MPALLESLESRTLYAAAPFTLQAEAAALSAPMVYSSNAGYTGSSYVDFQQTSGDWVEWTVNAAAAGTHKLSFRYANGGGDRPLELRVNGQVVRAKLSFP